MEKMQTIAGFSKYLFCMKTNRVWSKHSERFMLCDKKGKYRMIADDARYTCIGHSNDVTLMTPSRIRALVSWISGSDVTLAPLAQKVKTNPWFVLQQLGFGASFVIRCDTELDAKREASDLAAKNPRSVYIVAEQKHQVQSQGLVWA